MKLKEWLDKLNKLVESDPGILEVEVIYAKDEEGNSFEVVQYTPSIGFYDSKNQEFSGQESLYDPNEGENLTSVVCLN